MIDTNNNRKIFTDRIIIKGQTKYKNIHQQNIYHMTTKDRYSQIEYLSNHRQNR